MNFIYHIKKDIYKILYKLVPVKHKEKFEKKYLYYKKVIKHTNPIFVMNQIDKLTDRVSDLETQMTNTDKYLQNAKYEVADDLTKNPVKLPKILSIEETLNDIVQNQKSICRYGDGEFRYIYETDFPNSQYFNTTQIEKYQQKLKDILKSNNDRIMVCLWDFFGSLDNFSEYSKNIARNYMIEARDKMYKYIDFNKSYGNAFISRLYTTYNNESDSKKYFNLLKKIWNNRDIVIVEGAGCFLGLGNNLFDNAKSINRIECPSENAIIKYDEILSTIKMNTTKDKLIILALGMAATCLAYDLAEEGYWALDIGHIDLEYEWFMKKTKVPVPIKGKYINDIGQYDFIDISDEKFTNEIIAKIL